MDVSVLGPLEVRAGTDVVPVGGRLQRALLAALVAAHPRAATVGALVDALWPEDPPPSAQHTLQAHVSRLRSSTSLPVVAVDGGYRLDLPAEAIDAHRFERGLGRVADLEPGAAAERLGDLLHLWRGPAFGVSADLPGVRERAARLTELRDQAVERRVTALVRCGRAEDAVGLAEELVAAGPSRESAWAGLVRALVAAGRPADAVGAFARGAAALDELGLLPSADLRAAQAEAYDAGRAPARPQATPAPARRVEPGSPLPEPASTFVGREADLAVLSQLLTAPGLVSVVGPGGVGKTRLAIRAAADRAVRHPAGARFVDLSAVAQGPEVADAVLAGLGVTAEGGPPAPALRRAADLDAVVVLDNCEHLLDAVAEVVPLLLGGPLTVLATSRERLGIPGEQVHLLAPLGTDGADPVARLLFVERARSAGPLEDVAAADPEVLDRIVRAVDGLPLAIEMAAARAGYVGLAELADLLEGPASEGLAAMSHPDRAGAGRHRTLAELIAWSEALLEPAEHEALLAWPVLAGSVTATDAAAVTGTPRTATERLAARSLLRAWTDPSDGRTHYRLPHTVRAALLGRDDLPPLRHREHLDHVAGVARECDRAMRGSGEPAAVRRLAGLVPELRTAHRWARAHDAEAAADLSTDLHVFAMSTLTDQVLGWASQLAADRESPAADVGMAARLSLAGRSAAAAARAASALRHAPTPRVALQALEVLTDAALYDGELGECLRLGTRLVEAASAEADPWYEASAAVSVALAQGYGGDVPAGRATLATTRARLLGEDASPSVAGWLDYGEGELALDTDPAEAARLLGRAVRLADEAQNTYLGGVARVSASTVHARHGDPHQAATDLAAAAQWWLVRADHTHLVTTLRNLVDVLVRTDRHAAAAQLWGSVGDDTQGRTYGAEAAMLARARERLDAVLGEETLAEHVRTGAARTLAQAARAAIDATAGTEDPRRP